MEDRMDTAAQALLFTALVLCLLNAWESHLHGWIGSYCFSSSSFMTSPSQWRGSTAGPHCTDGSHKSVPGHNPGGSPTTAGYVQLPTSNSTGYNTMTPWGTATGTFCASSNNTSPIYTTNLFPSLSPDDWCLVPGFANTTP
jgi:hypothetical protein